MIPFLFRFFIVVILIVSLQPSTAWSKPEPVNGVFQMYNAFNKLEGELRVNKWDEVEKTILAIQTYYSRLSQELKKSIEANTINKFGFLLLKLKTDADNKEKEAAEVSYMKVQHQFLVIMGHFNYSVPPALTIYARYINEATEGLSGGDYNEAAEEMKEIIELRDHGVEAFSEKGVSEADINLFFANVEKVEEAARRKDLVKTQGGLHELEVFLNKYLLQDSTEKN